MKPVDFAGDRVRSEAVEINAVWHCNLGCRSCSHGSPWMPTKEADSEEVHADLERLSSVLSVDHVRVLGGEPLLHSNLPELLRAVKESGISDKVRMVTNGVNLESAEADVWMLCDEIHVSVYPNTESRWARVRPLVQKAAAAHAVRLTAKHFGFFRESFRVPNGDAALTARIHATCQIAHRWRCLTAEHGYLYHCPQAAVPNHREAGDGLHIQSIVGPRQLAEWMLGTRPLSACRSCTGSAGRLHVHTQQRRGEGTSEMHPSDPVDHLFLSELERRPDADNGCVVATETF